MADESARPVTPPARGALFAVVVLTAMNLLNYIDRWVPSAVKDLFKAELHLTDTQTSLPITAFVVVYMIASPFFGALADRWPRRYLIAAGVALWSAATASAAFARGFWSFLVARALVGVGEAAYATLAPSVLSDFYPPARRNTILTAFYVAIPVGSAIGFSAGGYLGESYGWRTAFLVCGLPGLVTAGLILLMREPTRGQFDPPVTQATLSWTEAIRVLARNREYVFTVAGYTAVTFASGALADWFPAFLSRHRGMSVGDAGALVGFTSVAGGLAGTVLGGLVGERLKGRTRQPYLAVSAFSMAVATVFLVLALLVPAGRAVGLFMFLGQFFLWFYNGPINAILVNCTTADLRARAFSLSILSIHLFGDALSPTLVGLLSEATSLPFAISLVPVALVVGTVIWIVGWRTLPDVTPIPSPASAHG